MRASGRAEGIGVGRRSLGVYTPRAWLGGTEELAVWAQYRSRAQGSEGDGHGVVRWVWVFSHRQRMMLWAGAGPAGAFPCGRRVAAAHAIIIAARAVGQAHTGGGAGAGSGGDRECISRQRRRIGMPRPALCRILAPSLATLPAQDSHTAISSPSPGHGLSTPQIPTPRPPSRPSFASLAGPHSPSCCVCVSAAHPRQCPCCPIRHNAPAPAIKWPSPSALAPPTRFSTTLTAAAAACSTTTTTTTTTPTAPLPQGPPPTRTPRQRPLSPPSAAAVRSSCHSPRPSSVRSRHGTYPETSCLTLFAHFPDYVVDRLADTVAASLDPAERRAPLKEPRLRWWVEQLIVRSRCRTSTVLVALTYLDKARPNLRISTGFWACERALIGALILANKVSSSLRAPWRRIDTSGSSQTTRCSARGHGRRRPIGSHQRTSSEQNESCSRSSATTSKLTRELLRHTTRRSWHGAGTSRSTQLRSPRASLPHRYHSRSLPRPACLHSPPIPWHRYMHCEGHP